jgi:hypothetical protein
MKKYLVLILVIVLTLALVIPVAAKGPGPGNGPNFPTGTNGTHTAYTQIQQGPRQTFAMVGTITAIDPVLMTLTISAIHGNKLEQESIGELVTVFVVDETRYLLKSGTIVAPITFENLEVGQQVSLNGLVSIENEIETWTAYRVTVGALLTQTHKR